MVLASCFSHRLAHYIPNCIPHRLADIVAVLRAKHRPFGCSHHHQEALSAPCGRGRGLQLRALERRAHALDDRGARGVVLALRLVLRGEPRVKVPAGGARATAGATRDPARRGLGSFTRPRARKVKA